MPTIDFIESRIERIPFSGCWLWMGATVEDGYGQIQVGRQFKRAHRVVYELLVGPIPERAHLLHRCDVPGCVNPAHLYPGTPKRNMADCIERGRFRAGWQNAEKTHCKRGHAFDETNTSYDAKGYRHCKKCDCAKVIRCQQRKRENLKCQNTL